MKLGLAAIVLVVLESQVHAGPSAEDLYNEGQRAYDGADYTTAIAKWKQSYELSGEPELLFNLAQALRLNGNCVDALTTYKRFVTIVPKSEQRALADDIVRELEPKCGVPSMTHPPTLDRRSTSAGRRLKIAGLATGGGGAVLVVAGLLMGRRASALGDEVSSACADICDWSEQRSKDAQGRRDAKIGYALDAVGVAAIGAGAVMYYVGSRADEVTVVPRAQGGMTVTWSTRW